MVAFNIKITSPGNLIVFPTGFYTVSLVITPQLGLFSNMLAQLVSQFLSHVIIWHHRNVVAEWDADGAERGRGSSGQSPTAPSHGSLASQGGIELGSIGESKEDEGMGGIQRTSTSTYSTRSKPVLSIAPPVPSREYHSGAKRAQRLHEMTLPRDPDEDDPERLNCFFFVLRTPYKNCLPLLFALTSFILLTIACGTPHWSFYPKTTNNVLSEEASVFERNFDLGFGLWASLQTFSSEACDQRQGNGEPCTVYTTYLTSQNVIGHNGTSVKAEPGAQFTSIAGVAALALAILFSQEDAVKKVGVVRISKSVVFALLGAIMSSVPIAVWNSKPCWRRKKARPTKQPTRQFAYGLRVLVRVSCFALTRTRCLLRSRTAQASSAISLVKRSCSATFTTSSKQVPASEARVCACRLSALCSPPSARSCSSSSTASTSGGAQPTPSTGPHSRVSARVPLRRVLSAREA